MRRIVSTLLSLALIFTMLPTFAFAEETSTETEAVVSPPKNIEEIEFIKAIKIIDSEVEFDPDEIMTRAEFSKILTIIAGIKEGELLSEPEMKFSDVPLDNDFAQYIYTAVQMGAINGYTDGKFRPDLAIDVESATKLMVSILGYDFVAQTRGAYPTGYLTVATELNLLKGISKNGTTALQKYDIAKLLYNSLKVDMMKQVDFGDDKKFEVVKGETLLKNRMDINYVKGQLDGIDITRLRGTSIVSPSQVSIDNIVMDKGDYNANSLLGYYVEAYYITDEVTNENIMVYISKLKGKNDESTFDLEDVVKIENSAVYIDDGDRTNTINYIKSSAIVYNGVSTTYPFNMNMLLLANGQKRTGNIKLLDSDSDGAVDVVFVNIYENYVISATNSQDNTVYDIYDNLKTIELNLKNDEPYVLLESARGDALGFGSIQPWDVVSVYKSLDDAEQTLIRAVVPKNTISGTIDEISQNEGFKTISVKGKYYELDKTFEAKNTFNIAVGANVALCIDVNGRVAGMKNTSGGGWKWGFVIDAKVGAKIDKNVELYIYTPSNTAITLQVSSKVMIDSISMKDSNTILTRLNAGSKLAIGATDSTTYSQLIQYETNSDNFVTGIDTILEGIDPSQPNADKTLTVPAKIKANDALYLTPYTGSLYYKTTINGFEGKFIVDASTLFFIHPKASEAKDKTNYRVVPMSYFIHDAQYSLTGGYNDIAKTGISQAITLSPNDFTEPPRSHTYSIIIDKFVDALDKEGVAIKKLYGYTQGKNVEYLFKSDVKSTSGDVLLKNLACGDVIRVYTDRDNQIAKYELIYTIKEDKSLMYTGITFTNGTRFLTGYVFAKYGDVGLFKITDDKTKLNEEPYEKHMLSKFITIVVYDGTGSSPKITLGSPADVYASEDVGSDCSRFLMQTYSGEPRTLYIIKK